jgi:hypothetical protein
MNKPGLKSFVLLWSLLGMTLMFISCTREVVFQDILPEQVLIEAKPETPDSVLFAGLNTIPEIRLIEMQNISYGRAVTDPNQNIGPYTDIVQQRPYVHLIVSGFVMNTEIYRHSFSVNLSNMQYVSHQKDWVAVVDSLQFKRYHTEYMRPSILAYVPAGSELKMSERIRNLEGIASANPVLVTSIKDEKANILSSLWKNI